jgi:hypothetical protein
MPYIPEPLNLKYDDQLPIGHYTTYITWYGDNCTNTRRRLCFGVTGYTKSGAMKITLDPSRNTDKEKITRTRKNGHFMLPTTNEGHGGKQITEVFPYHYSVKQQMELEENFAVEGETILI